MLLELSNPEEPARACAAKLHAPLLSRLPPWDPAARSSRSCHQRNERQNGCTILYQGIVLLLACSCRWWAACHWLCFALAFAAAGELCAAWWLFASNPYGYKFRLSRMTCFVLPNHNTSCFWNGLTVLVLLTQRFRSLQDDEEELTEPRSSAPSHSGNCGPAGGFQHLGHLA